MSASCYIGMMSGTSLDGVDVVVVRFGATLEVLAQQNIPYPSGLYAALQTLPDAQSIHALATLDTQLGVFFADSITKVLATENIAKENIIAVGLHGQTIGHQPTGLNPYTVQIGDPNYVAYQTGITTVADFRRKDMAAGGQGAPLVPAFHQRIFADTTKNRVVLNIGGIANITYLPKSGDILGFDTGPGNGLLDAWIQKHKNLPFDEAGKWAASGTVDKKLLTKLKQEPYFLQPYPKSTGREYFNLAWLSAQVGFDLLPQDMQATLSMLTAQTIAESIGSLSAVDEVLVCGGGIKNTYLMEQLRVALKGISIISTADYGVNPDWVEAIAFAWLAKQTLEQKPGNIPSVTGAKEAVVLGAVYTPD